MLILTGGAGFIGSNLLSALETEDVVVVDHLGFGNKWKNIAKHKIYDVIHPLEFFEWTKGRQSKIHGVIHLGAVTDSTYTDGNEIVESNVRYSLRLLEFCTEYNFPFVYASSAATYGNGPFDDETPLEELRPTNLYAWSKHVFDRMVESHKTPKHCVGLKFFNVYGPNEYHKGSMASIVYQYFLNQELQLFQHPEHEPERDFIYVNDVVDVILWAWDSFQGKGLFNVGTGIPTSFLDMCTYAAIALDRDVDFKRTRIPDSILPSYQFSTKATTSKLREAGYVDPFTPPSVGVKDYVTLLKSNDPYV